jgi:hypothetical protein
MKLGERIHIEAVSTPRPGLVIFEQCPVCKRIDVYHSEQSEPPREPTEPGRLGQYCGGMVLKRLCLEHRMEKIGGLGMFVEPVNDIPTIGILETDMPTFHPDPEVEAVVALLRKLRSRGMGDSELGTMVEDSADRVRPA